MHEKIFEYDPANSLDSPEAIEVFLDDARDRECRFYRQSHWSGRTSARNGRYRGKSGVLQGASIPIIQRARESDP